VALRLRGFNARPILTLAYRNRLTMITPSRNEPTYSAKCRAVMSNVGVITTAKLVKKAKEMIDQNQSA